jgi:medium-chain acyl-[acyl-carrier-protein] hydrolase
MKLVELKETVATGHTFNKWVKCVKPRPRLRLFCFPYAGGSASIFYKWSEYLPNTVEICPIQLPGRENRIRERPYNHITPLIEALAQALLPYLNVPFAFWGHSMGALISFELARQLRREGKPRPFQIFISSHRAPQLPNLRLPISQLPEIEFVRELRKLNGTPELVFQNRELMQIFLPVLRADFALLETYTYTNEEPLDSSISAFGGLQDERVSCDELKCWQEQTHGSFNLSMFPGGHFYLHEYRVPLLAVLSQDVRQILNRISH